MNKQWLIVYFACNLFLALAMHLNMLKNYDQPPKRQVVVYFLLFALIGIPAMILSTIWTIGRMVSTRTKRKTPYDPEIDPPRDNDTSNRQQSSGL